VTVYGIVLLWFAEVAIFKNGLANSFVLKYNDYNLEEKIYER